MHFAREAWPLVVPPLLIGVGLLTASVLLDELWLGALGVLLVGLSFGILLFFRDPDRKVPADSESVVAPADGVVVEVEMLPNGRKFVAVFLSVFNVHVNRSPFCGVVTSVVAKPGTYRHANSREGAIGNARVDVELESPAGVIRFSQLSGLVARKISCRVRPGDSLATGERFGLIYFGSRMEIELPPSATIMVTAGLKTRAGETVIAKLPDLP